MGIYLDNAATTALDYDVLQTMLPFWQQDFGNPSSSHKLGRNAKLAIEQARETVAYIIGATPAEIYFTSGATESNNLGLRGIIEKHEIKHVITSHLEHHAVLNPLRFLERSGVIRLSYVENDSAGKLNLDHLESLLLQTERTIVSIMHGNNEIGTLNDIDTIASLCSHYNVLLHSDTVQTISHYQLDVKALDITMLVASAHKFHGPKGVGFLYVNKKSRFSPLVMGGGQERGLRAGTENVAGIVGLARALEISHTNIDGHRQHVSVLKNLLARELKDIDPAVTFHGLSTNASDNLCTVLSVSFPEYTSGTNILSYLDRQEIYVSGGSACNSSHGHSHVQQAIGAESGRSVIRFSFGRNNTHAEILQVSLAIKSLLESPPVGNYDRLLQA